MGLLHWRLRLKTKSRKWVQYGAFESTLINNCYDSQFIADQSLDYHVVSVKCWENMHVEYLFFSKVGLDLNVHCENLTLHALFLY